MDYHGGGVYKLFVHIDHRQTDGWTDRLTLVLVKLLSQLKRFPLQQPVYDNGISKKQGCLTLLIMKMDESMDGYVVLLGQEDCFILLYFYFTMFCICIQWVTNKSG